MNTGLWFVVFDALWRLDLVSFWTIRHPLQRLCCYVESLSILVDDVAYVSEHDNGNSFLLSINSKRNNNIMRVLIYDIIIIMYNSYTLLRQPTSNINYSISLRETQYAETFSVLFISLGLSFLITTIVCAVSSRESPDRSLGTTLVCVCVCMCEVWFIRLGRVYLYVFFSSFFLLVLQRDASITLAWYSTRIAEKSHRDNPLMKHRVEGSQWTTFISANNNNSGNESFDDELENFLQNCRRRKAGER